jgi:hypothetical protein
MEDWMVECHKDFGGFGGQVIDFLKKLYSSIIINFLKTKTGRSSDFMFEISWLSFNEQY